VACRERLAVSDLMEPARARLPGDRLHLQHGPIDLVIECWGDAGEVRRAHEQAWERFQDVLETLVSELPVLRTPLAGAHPLVRGPVARRMVAACWPHRRVFITPMAAVAGAVADEMLAALLAGRTLAKAYVNDGGDIAFYLGAGESLAAGIVNDPRKPLVDASLRLSSSCGVATSGWRGRSQSLGIADAVTVVARTAATADAAATLIANAVNVDHPSIRRLPAREVKHDSDLGDRLVTVAVEALPRAIVQEALERGLDAANGMRAGGLIDAACLALQGETRVTGGLPILAARNAG
jgi:ApbE superfamily uncharacterized protein (UPF0280 family)